jgi:Spherulation-specific family 4
MSGVPHRRSLRSLFAVALVSLACFAVAVVLVGITSARLPVIASTKPGPCRGVLIPAYVPPSELADLSRRSAPRRVVVLNPASGTGPTRDPKYASAVQSLQSTETRVLGYVATGYGSRPAGEILAEIDRYVAWYGVDGIFLDESSSDRAALAHYRALGEAARTDRGLMVVQNPGVVPDLGYFATADVIVTFEGPHSAYAERTRERGQLTDVPPAKIAHLIYEAPSDASTLAVDAGKAGYVYATPGVLPNPWGRLAPSLAVQGTAGETCDEES